MTDLETKKMIDALIERVAKLENKDFKQHGHTGLDGYKVKVANLDSVTYKETTINPGSLVDAAGATVSVAVTGANLGDWVLVSAPYDLQDIIVTGYVQAQDVVEIRIQNEGAATVDLASGIWRILVIKKFLE